MLILVPEAIVILKNVDFYNIVTRSFYVITGYTISNTYKRELHYDGGNVELVNNGYEISGNLYGNGFVWFAFATKVTIRNVKISNSIFNYVSEMLGFDNVYSLEISDCIFEYNYAETYIVYVSN